MTIETVECVEVLVQTISSALMDLANVHLVLSAMSVTAALVDLYVRTIKFAALVAFANALQVF